MMSEERKDSPTSMFGKRAPLLVAILASIGGLTLLCLFGVLIIDPFGGRGEPDGEDGQVENGTVTPVTQPIPISTSLPDTVITVGDGQGGIVTVTLDSPTRLNVGGSEFFVQGQLIEPDGIWALSNPTEDSAVWVYGTVINYILGMLDSDANQALLDRLQPGDEIVLTKSDGSTFTFAVSGRQIVQQGDRNIFAQNTPGITLVLMEPGSSGNAQRTVVQGRYVVSETAPDQGIIPQEVEVGDPFQLEGLQITATGASFIFDRPEIPPGFAFYLVDYQLQNVGTSAFDSSRLRLVLADELGNQYALNPTASQLGNYPILGVQVPAGQAVQATAGYQVPVALNSANLFWVVSLTDANAEVRVKIPFGGGNQGASEASISLQQGTVSLDGTSLLLVGQITNLGGQPLIIEDNDLRLESEGTFHLILSTNPGFPWVVGPGQTIPFSVTFQRPVGASAVFTILNQPFQLSGLR